MIVAAMIGLGVALGFMGMCRRRTLPPVAPFGPPPERAVSVIVPARNEARTLPGLLRSLASAGPGVHEVIVVDDNSTDETAQIAASHGARVVRLTGEPPPGWTGKNRACAQGASIAVSPLLVFLDADVVMGPGSVSKLIWAHATSGGLVSVQPYHTVERAHEQLSAVCNVVSMLGSGAFAAWSNRSRPAAFGPCLVTSASDYHLAGGHTAVRGEVVEDVSLARRYAAHGLPVTVLIGADDVAFRMYGAGSRELIDGWTKNLSAGSRLAHPLSVAVAVWWVAACLAVGVGSVQTLVEAGKSTRADLALAAAAWLAVTIQLRWMLRRIGTFRWWTAVLHPIPMWAFVALFLRSAWLTFVRRSVRWRGRRIELGQRQAG